MKIKILSSFLVVALAMPSMGVSMSPKAAHLGYARLTQSARSAQASIFSDERMKNLTGLETVMLYTGAFLQGLLQIDVRPRQLEGVYGTAQDGTEHCYERNEHGYPLAGHEPISIVFCAKRYTWAFANDGSERCYRAKLDGTPLRGSDPVAHFHCR